MNDDETARLLANTFTLEEEDYEALLATPIEKKRQTLGDLVIGSLYWLLAVGWVYLVGLVIVALVLGWLGLL